MNILFISPGYLPRIGGVEIFIANLAEYFLKNGHSVKIITQKYPRSLKSREYIESIEVKRYLFFDPKTPPLKLRSIAAYVYALLLAPINLLRVILSIRKVRPEVINYQFIGAPTLYLLVYTLLFDTKLIVTTQGADVKSIPFESKVSMWLFRKILRKAHFVTANSRFLLSETVKMAPYIKNKSKIIYNGINFEKFKNSELYRNKDKYILTVGRFVYKKGFDILIKAFNLAVREIQEVNLIIAGDGPQRGALEELTQRYNLTNKIKFYGWANREELVQLLKGCEFFVSPSRDEPFGIVIIEALAMGKPVVATRSGGPEEIIKSGINGLLVPKENSKALGEAIVKLLKDVSFRNGLTNYRQSIIEKFGIERIGKQYLDIFKACGLQQ
ncbi:MAG: glycosyltransferase family 4 protein [Omnitrophica bacterium]|nr:glycosyltransferase family 4 protein [Candidatus Omnitrophota bacterium]